MSPDDLPPPNVTGREFCGYRTLDEWGAQLSCLTFADYRLAVAPDAPLLQRWPILSCARHLPAYLRDGWILPP